MSSTFASNSIDPQSSDTACCCTENRQMETGQTTAGRLSFFASWRPPHRWWQALPGLAGIAIVALGYVTWAIVNFGSLHHAWLYATGVRVAIEPSTVMVQEVRPAEKRNVVFLVRNLTDKPVHLLGAKTECTCFYPADKLSLAIPARGTKELHLVPKQA
jgi:hypothetical protein